MTPRPLPPVAGHLAWICHVPPEPIPEGLNVDQPVFVAVLVPPYRALVKDSQGHEHLVATTDLDCGYEFFLNAGYWAHENDPRVLTELRKLQAQARAERPLGSERINAAYLDLITRIIRRNECLRAAALVVANRPELSKAVA